MKVGIVAQWFNRGQGAVAKTIYRGLIEAGHEPHVLARRTPETFFKPNFVDRTAEWDLPRVSYGSSSEMKFEEYMKWAGELQLEAILFYQNYDFDSIRRLRQAGILTFGGFVWESFAQSHALCAKLAFSSVFSLTRSEQIRYHSFGIDTPLLDFPAVETSNSEFPKGAPTPYFLFNGGYLSKRKPLGAVLRAYGQSCSAIALTVKSQKPLSPANLTIPLNLTHLNLAFKVLNRAPGLLPISSRLAGINVIQADISESAMSNLIGGAQALITPSRWEGLGLHIYESIALGVPILTNRMPPVSDILSHGENAFFTESRSLGRLPNGLRAYEPRVGSLARGIRAMENRNLLDDLRFGLLDLKSRRTLANFGAGLNDLLRTAV